MNVQDLFFDEHRTLRSGWRVAIFIAAFIAVAVATTIAGSLGLSLFSILVPGSGAALGFLVSGIALLIPALVVGWLCGKLLERVPFRALGASFTPRWLVHLLAGVVAGAATLSLAVLIAMALGGLRFELNPAIGNGLLKSLCLSLLIFAVGAAWEEALFRGYILQTLNRSGLAWVGIALTSLFFGAIHLGNPGATAISTIDTMLAGVWFGIAYLKTRDLWFVWGMHLMWNWMQGSIYGIEVSGLTDLVSTPLLREIDSGPAWLTGTTYGIEGGIASTLALVVSTIVIWFWPLKRSDDSELGAISRR